MSNNIRQFLHPRLLKPLSVAAIVFLFICGYVAGIVVIIVKLAQGASLRLIALCLLLAPAVLALNVAAWSLSFIPWRSTLMIFWRWPRTIALLLWLRVKYGKQHPDIYTPVDSKNHQIRLLVIDAGRTPEEIKCSLLPVFLGNDCPRYEALSYTWGSSHSPRYIVLGGYPLAIASNLHSALKRLRKSDGPRVMWVDALSIDQQNITERGEQVSIMKLIYSYASKVVIWLGEPSLSSRYAMDLLCSANEQGDPSIWLSNRLRTRSQSDMIQWKGLLSLFREAYWGRVWIIQETAVARDLEIVCGNYTCQWEVAVAAQNAWMMFKAMPVSREQQEIIDYIEDFTKLERTAFLGTLVPKNTGPMPLSINRNNISLSRETSLVGLLQENWASLATDPRDKIFALLGLATDCQTPPLSSDYSLSQWETYLNMMKFLLENHGSLDIIAYSGIHLYPFPPPFYRAPSWTPAFYWAWETHSTATYSQYLYKNSSGTLRASNNRKAVAKFLPQHKSGDKMLGINRAILQAKSYRIDRISKILYNPGKLGIVLSKELEALKKKLRITSNWLPASRFDIGHEDRNLVDDMRTLYHYFVLDGKLSSHVQSVEERLKMERKTDTLWRTLCLNRNIDGTEAPTRWSSAFKVVLDGPSHVPADYEAPQGLSADDRAMAYILPFLQAIRQLQVGKRWLFETEAGRVGIANYGALVGDYVCVILGCCMPMVMRERKMPPGDEFVQAQLYGAAYLHEYMQGKAMEELEVGNSTLETLNFV